MDNKRFILKFFAPVKVLAKGFKLMKRGQYLQKS